jgi:hypothetical protein
MDKSKINSVFISHSSADKSFAQMIAARLREHDLDAWIDNDKILAGDNILESIGGGLTTMDLLVFIVSQASLNSPWRPFC